MKRRLYLVALITYAANAQNITWTQKTVLTGGSNPGAVGFTIPVYDPVSGQTFHYLKAYGSSTIYSTRGYFYNPDGDGAWTAMTSGYSSMSSLCTTSTSSVPGERHPVWHLALDTSRNRIWLFGGPNAACTGIPPATYGPNSNPRGDMYYLSLTSTPADNTWTSVDISGTIAANNPDPVLSSSGSAMVYDSDNDLLFLWLHAHGLVYCLGSTLTTAQQEAGCTQLNTWERADPFTGGVHPSRSGQIGMVYSPIKQRAYLFGGHVSDVHQDDTWEYNIRTRTWTEKCQGACTPPPVGHPAVGIAFMPSMVYNSLTGKIHLRQYGGTGAPGDWVYDPDADTWTELSTTGGPTLASSMAFDPVRNQLIAYTNNGGGDAEMWVGQISQSTTTVQSRILGTWPSGNAKWIEVCGVEDSLTTGSTTSVTLTGAGGLSVPITIHEGVHSGITGVSRTNEPWCQGIPVADSAGLTSVASLALSGGGSVDNVDLATDGSTITVDTGDAVFSIKKANTNLIDSVVIGGTTVVSSSASATRGLVLLGPAAGSYPGNVTCNSTGSDCTTVYSSANDDNSTCEIEKNGPIEAVVKCTGTHKDSSDNPYMQFTARMYFRVGQSSVKTTVVLRNANYSTAASPSSDYNSGTGLTFNVAYKGFKSYELRIGANITGTLDYSIGTHSTAQTGTLDQSGGTDEAYIYQGASESLLSIQSSFICYPGSPCADSYTTDDGYIAKKNSTTLASGTTAQYPEGWADIRNSSGVGVLIGMDSFAAQWPASLEFTAGGTDVRLGIYSARNTGASYMPWPHWEIRDVYMVFHTSTPSSLPNEFKRLQYPLMARASVSHYNSSGALPFPLAESAHEDAYYVATRSVADPAVSLSNYCYGSDTSNCTPDRSSTDSGLINTGMFVARYRGYGWGLGGALNQVEHRWSDLMRFLQRGQVGRWTNSRNFYRYLAGRGWAHADGTSSSSSTVNGFTWRSRHASEKNGWGWPILECGADDVNPYGCPTLANSDKSVISLALNAGLSVAHAHIEGVFDYYFLSGDETIKEAVMPLKDWAMATSGYQVSGQSQSTRNLGVTLKIQARMAEFLSAIGDASDAATMIATAVSRFDDWAKPDSCVSGYPSGCTAVTLNTYPAIPDTEPAGINRKRGVHTAPTFRGSYWCTDAANPGGIPAYYRAQTPFQAAIFAEGLLHLRRVKGSAWSDYNLALDLAYGISQWALAEAFSYDGQEHWYVGGGTQATDSLYNGFRFGVGLERNQLCDDPGNTAVAGITTEIAGVKYNNTTLAQAHASMWLHFYVQYMVNGQISTEQQRKLRQAVNWIASTQSNWPADFGGYQIGANVYALNNVTSLPQAITPGVVDNGGGSYTLSWTELAGTTSHRVKWSDLTIVDWIGYDEMTATWEGDPDTEDNWFAATNAGQPTCTSGTCSITIATGETGLTAGNFSVRAYTAVTGGSSSQLRGVFRGGRLQ